jgi:hypothetical protein
MTSIYSVLNASQAAVGYPSGSSSNTTGSKIPATSLSQPESQSVTRAIGAAHARDTKSWYEAMAKAWGQALDHQAGVMTQMADGLTDGGMDNPAQLIVLSAEAQRFSYMATSASTATNSVGEALSTLGRKD